MAVFYLMSGGDPQVMGSITRDLDISFLDKMKRNGFIEVGKLYHAKSIWVVDDNPRGGETTVYAITEGAQSAGTENPRLVYIQNPNDALSRFPSERPDVVVTDYEMESRYGINGDELIRRMREMEKGF
ncbi:MAG: hypothetical protein HYT72_04710 [Candidatus Aenigmarchaeota archaeon]|nr:hypothetical protein [Candidatus Aenigmarchaeota archaeon]